jgi:hypothetical protein
VLAILFFLFATEYLFTPYWKLATSLWQQILLATLTGAAGLAWAFLSSGSLELRPRAKGFLWFLAALAIVGAINAPALFADLTWRGDEDHHFQSTLMLADILLHYWPRILILLAPLALAAAFQRKGRATGKSVWQVAGLSAAAAAAVVIAGLWAEPPFRLYLVGHYPLATNWLAAQFVAVSKIVAPGSTPPEAAFRIVPLLSAVLLAWVCARKATDLSVPARLLYILAVGSIPVILYYSSILYLEMPAILLMTVVCLEAKGLLTAEPADLSHMPAWYALVLCGFIKDSIPPLLGAVFLARACFRLFPRASRGPLLRGIVREAGVAACIALPYLTFWFYRTFYSHPDRVYSPNPAWLVDLRAWGTILWALLEQFGPAAVLFPLVLFLAPGSRRTPKRVLLALAFSCWAAAHIMDRCTSKTNVSNGTGFSRYMLLFAPMLIAGLHEAVRYAAARKAWVAAAGLALVVGVNFAITPMHLDGARRPGWGEYRYYFAEHSYPYRSALAYVTSHYPTEETLITGLDYRYWYEYYAGQTDRVACLAILRPESEFAECTASGQMLAHAAINGYRHVLYHALWSALPRSAVTSGYVVERVFRNSSHMIVLYSMPSGGVGLGSVSRDDAGTPPRPATVIDGIAASIYNGPHRTKLAPWLRSDLE